MTDQVIPITRPQSVVSQPVTSKPEQKFPTEVINLPSKGWFYPENNPLSSGKIELKMMTAKEEDILTSKNLLQKGIALDKLLESLIVDKSINADDLLNCDRNALLLAIRRLAYGDEYDAIVNCGRCGKENKIKFDLGKMDNKPFNFDDYPKGQNVFDLVLPHSNRSITLKLLTKDDDEKINAEVKSLEKIFKEVSKEVTTRLKYIITSVDGNADKAHIRRFVDNELLSKDSLAIRGKIKSMPDVDTSFDFTCSNCGAERREEMPLEASFFWPNG